MFLAWQDRKLWDGVSKYYLSSPLFAVTISNNTSYIESRMFKLYIFQHLLFLSYQINFCHDPTLT